MKALIIIFTLCSEPVLIVGTDGGDHRIAGPYEQMLVNPGVLLFLDGLAESINSGQGAMHKIEVSESLGMICV